jgi:uncharacterized membrane protein
MNKLLVAVFDTEAAANTGLNALRTLHAAGDITLYATAVIAREASTAIVVKKPMITRAIGTFSGLAVGSLIGLLGGPVGMAIGAVTGTVAGAVRDFWAAGVGLDFIEVASQHLKPGNVALLAEIEEEWVIPVDLALEAAGGHVFRRSRSELGEAHYQHDVTALKAEINELEAEASQAGEAAKAQLLTKVAVAKTALDSALHRGQQRLDALKQEADDKAESLRLQLSLAKSDARVRIEGRAHRVRNAYHVRSSKLSHAWQLTKEALAA